MKQKITPKELGKLPQEEQYFYFPFYEKYKKVRKRSYCEDCGHFEGYYYEERGVGEPIGYRYSAIKGYWLKKTMETFYKSNVLKNITKINEPNKTRKI